MVKLASLVNLLFFVPFFTSKYTNVCWKVLLFLLKAQKWSNLFWSSFQFSAIAKALLWSNTGVPGPTTCLGLQLCRCAINEFFMLVAEAGEHLWDSPSPLSWSYQTTSTIAARTCMVLFLEQRLPQNHPTDSKSIEGKIRPLKRSNRLENYIMRSSFIAPLPHEWH